MARTETHLHGAVRHPHETELAGALAPASKKPRLFLEAPAVGPTTTEPCAARRVPECPVISVQGFVTAPHSRAVRPGLARNEGAPPWPPETELAGALAPACKKPHLVIEAPAVGPITVEACVARRGAAHPEFERSRLRDGTHSRAFRPDLLRAEAAGLGARAGFATSSPHMERTR